MEHRIIIARHGKTERMNIPVRFPTEPPWRIEAVTPWGESISAEDVDLFYALRQIRLALEKYGVHLCCNGARLDVWPSGMSGQMSGGRSAYMITTARRPSKDDLVDIFDPAPCSSVGSVDEQWEEVRSRHGV